MERPYCLLLIRVMKLLSLITAYKLKTKEKRSCRFEYTNCKKEIIQAGFSWANWTDEQKKAFKIAWEALNQQIDASNHLLVLQKEYEVQLISAGENGWSLRLFDKDERDKEVYKDRHENLNKLLIDAIEWMQRNIEL
jgi:hypothetical protein